MENLLFLLNNETLERIGLSANVNDKENYDRIDEILTSVLLRMNIYEIWHDYLYGLTSQSHVVRYLETVLSEKLIDAEDCATIVDWYINGEGASTLDNKIQDWAYDISSEIFSTVCGIVNITYDHDLNDEEVEKFILYFLGWLEDYTTKLGVEVEDKGFLIDFILTTNGVCEVNSIIKKCCNLNTEGA